MSTEILIAASQFPVSGDISRNIRYILRHIERAAAVRATVVLFPETALPGYGPKHIESIKGYDWTRLSDCLVTVCNAARTHNIWVVLGSMRQQDQHLPLNCVHVISDEGQVKGTYDKRYLYRNEKEFYSSGYAPLVIDINSHSCGFLICNDNCYPKLYEEYRDLGVTLLFHSVFNAENEQATSISDLMDANLIVRAADHQMCIAASNSSAPYCPMPATIAKPDGTTVRAKRHVTSLVFDSYPPANLGWTYDNRT